MRSSHRPLRSVLLALSPKGPPQHGAVRAPAAPPPLAPADPDPAELEGLAGEGADLEEEKPPTLPTTKSSTKHKIARLVLPPDGEA